MEREQAGGNVLRNVDVSRRAFLKKLVLSSAFVVPAVASFSMTGSGIEKAQAQVSNQRFPNDPGNAGGENCYGQTIAYLEHINEQEFGDFLEALASALPSQGPTLAHGIAGLADQWCKYGYVKF